MKGAWLFFLLVLLSGCYSSSMMQTAKTLDKGESEVSLGVSGYLQPDAGGVAPDLMWRQGISDKSDMGVGYSVGFYGHARVDWKREIWSNPTNTTFLSTGLGFDGYFPNDFSGEPFYYGVNIPLYFSFNHGKEFVPYFGQKFSFGFRDLKVFQYYNNDDLPQQNLYYYHQMFYSGGAGVRYGKRRFKWFAELSYLVSIYRYVTQYSYTGENDVELWRANKSFGSGMGVQLTLGVSIDRKKQ